MKVPITVDLISQIARLPKAGVYQSQYFKGKASEKLLATKIKNKYDVVREKHTYAIKFINDKAVQVVAKVLVVKIVQKNRPNQCTSGVISCAEQCAKGVQMNQSMFLLNQLMEDIVLVQEGRRPFTYSWLLILITLVGWMEPKYYQRMGVEVVRTCRGARYQNLWVLEDKEQQIDCNVQFYLYYNRLREATGKVQCLTDAVVTKYLRVA